MAGKTHGDAMTAWTGRSGALQTDRERNGDLIALATWMRWFNVVR